MNTPHTFTMNNHRKDDCQLLFFEGRLNSMFTAFCHNHTKLGSPFNIIPRVHAADDVVTNPDTESSQTTMDKLIQSRPATMLIVSDREVLEQSQRETGMDRLSIMFSKNHKGEYSQDFSFPVNVAKTSGGMTFFLAAIAGSKNAREKFIAKNKATKFETKFKAVRAYNDAVFFGGLRNGLKYSIKTGVFAGMFMLGSQTIAVYRNKSSILEYLIAGSLTGGIFRLNLGLRGFIGGGFIGTVIGLLGGGMMLVLLKSGNETQEQRNYWRIHESIRQDKEMKAMFGNREEDLPGGEALPQ